MRPELSIIIPAYNEAARLPQTVKDVIAHVEGRHTFEIILVDDGSTDETADMIAALASAHPAVYPLAFARNRGKGAAVREGMLSARGAHRLFMDADHSVHISHLEEFLAGAAAGDDVVIASIAIPGAVIDDVHGSLRRFAGAWAKYLIRATVLPGIYDTQRGFKLYSASAAEAVFADVKVSGWGFDIEALTIARERGFRIRELPVFWQNMKRSDIGPWDYVTTLADLAYVLFRRLLGGYRPLSPHKSFPPKVGQ
jgi:dolichyl-phosphate beta-glucosyltransferase